MIPFALRSLAPRAIKFEEEAIDFEEVDFEEVRRGRGLALARGRGAPPPPSAGALLSSASLGLIFIATTGIGGSICVWDGHAADSAHGELRAALAVGAKLMKRDLPSVKPLTTLRFDDGGSAGARLLGSGGAAALAWAPADGGVMRLAGGSATPGAVAVAIWDVLRAEPLIRQCAIPYDVSDGGTHSRRTYAVTWQSENTLLIGDGCGRVSLLDTRVGGNPVWTASVGPAMRDAQRGAQSRPLPNNTTYAGGGPLAANAPPRGTISPNRAANTNTNAPPRGTISPRRRPCPIVAPAPAPAPASASPPISLSAFFSRKPRTLVPPSDPFAPPPPLPSHPSHPLSRASRSSPL